MEKESLEDWLHRRDYSERLIGMLRKRIKRIEKIRDQEEQEIDKLLYNK
jgi:hypothetical protein